MYQAMRPGAEMRVLVLVEVLGEVLQHWVQWGLTCARSVESGISRAFQCLPEVSLTWLATSHSRLGTGGWMPFFLEERVESWFELAFTVFSLSKLVIGAFLRFLGGSIPFLYHSRNFFLYWSILKILSKVYQGQGDNGMLSYVARKP